MLQNNLEANQAKLEEGLSPTPLNPMVNGAYLGMRKINYVASSISRTSDGKDKM